MKIIEKLKNIVKKEDEKLNFKEIATEWLEQRKITIKESTYAKYSMIINKHLLPYFENFEKMPLAELKDYCYNEFVTTILKDLSAKTVKEILHVY